VDPRAGVDVIEMKISFLYRESNFYSSFVHSLA
jgi:hypothetical protein